MMDNSPRLQPASDTDKSISVSSDSNIPSSSSIGAGAEPGLNGPMPDELRRWNWGAYLLSLFWAMFYTPSWAIAILIFYVFISPSFLFFPFLVVIPQFIIGIPFGLKGNEWAWRKRSYDSVDHFLRSQRIWIYLAIPFYAIILLPYLAMIFVT